ncbi:hypothetical protein [Hirschia baltica]|uniref:Type IV pilus assembly PilZ n=1 Tax=Hirschia baltica (strain ATCC 49814 / DSM 5838 / IFAM 1418) TaxID=582402 RepID=C6XNP2_HIRBI|nr:hypothetical protein [Hirschia baltica]ACT58295.1 hypothetical protein Hbal_0593 [Hirschia baltica ATCC 49814]
MSIWDILKFKSKKNEVIEEITEEEPADLRAGDREIMYRDSRVYYPSGGSEPCIINDVSETGLRISCQGAKNFPERIRIQYAGKRRQCDVIWRDGIVAGLAFVEGEGLREHAPIQDQDLQQDEVSVDTPFAEDPLK